MICPLEPISPLIFFHQFSGISNGSDAGCQSMSIQGTPNQAFPVFPIIIFGNNLGLGDKKWENLLKKAIYQNNIKN